MDEHNNIIHSGYANVKQEGHHLTCRWKQNVSAQ